jgi:hypothetical protein
VLPLFWFSSCGGTCVRLGLVVLRGLWTGFYLRVMCKVLVLGFNRRTRNRVRFRV